MQMCMRCHAVKKLVIGALVLINAFLWPMWTGIDGWLAFFGVLMVLGGFLMLVMPPCKSCMGACSTEKTMPMAKKR